MYQNRVIRIINRAWREKESRTRGKRSERLVYVIPREISSASYTVTYVTNRGENHRIGENEEEKQIV